MLKVDEEAEIVFPSIVNIYGTRSIIEGRITGVHNLIIASGGAIEFSSTAETAKVENRQYVEIDKKGNFSFGTLTVERNSQIVFSRVGYDLSLRSAELRVKYEGLMKINYGSIMSAFAWIESKGHLTLDGTGNAPEKGFGRGKTVANIGTGAGHGGEGGRTSSSEGGLPYGSVYSPHLSGSGGGNGQGTGGSGGGVLAWKVSKRFQLNGLLSARGTNAVGLNGGGGSGGSILIETTNMTGHGEISVTGGSGTGIGGGGK